MARLLSQAPSPLARLLYALVAREDGNPQAVPPTLETLELATLWESEPDACVLLQLLARLDHRAAVLAACACARTTLHLIPADEPRVSLALALAERWARGEVDAQQVEAAATQADPATAGGATSQAAVTAALAAAWSVLHPRNVGEAAAEAAAALAGDPDDPARPLDDWRRAHAHELTRLADLVRETAPRPDLGRLVGL